MKKVYAFLVVVLILAGSTKAQNVGIGTNTPSASAKLEISDTTKGLLIPRMSLTQRNNITTPAKGLLVYVNTDSSFYYYTGSLWQKLNGAGNATAWAQTGNANATGKFIGTLDTSAFRINTNNTERITVDSSGKVGVGTTTPAAQLHVMDQVLVTGTVDSGDTIVPTGAGTRMFFNARKAAFRAGYIDGGNWDNSTVGQYSVAMGAGGVAAFGSTALGWYPIASNSFASAIGYHPNAEGAYSNAMGFYSYAKGNFSTAIGFLGYAQGLGSVSLVNGSAIGDYSTALGVATSAKSFAETVIGSNNTDYTPDSVSSWGVNDRLLVVGNGKDGSTKSDAMTILKNGKVGIGTSNLTYPGTTANNKMVLASEDQSNIDFIHSYANSSNALFPGYGFARAGGTLAAPAIITNGMYQGGIYSTGYDGANYQMSSGIYFITDGTPSLNTVPGKIVFLTTSAGSVNPVSRMVINNAGNVGIGVSNPVQTLDVGGKAHVLATTYDAGFTQSTLQVEGTSQSRNYPCIAFNNQFNNTFNQLYSLGSSGGFLCFTHQGGPGSYVPISASAFNVNSDLTLKKDITPVQTMADYQQYLNQIRHIDAITYRYNDESDNASSPSPSGKVRLEPHIGFSAQSLPAAVQTKMPADTKPGAEMKLGYNLSDMAGLTLIGIKALDAQTVLLIKQNEELLKTNTILKADIENLKLRLDALEKRTK